jgi:hypothetical protein
VHICIFIHKHNKEIKALLEKIAPHFKWLFIRGFSRGSSLQAVFKAVPTLDHTEKPSDVPTTAKAKEED